MGESGFTVRYSSRTNRGRTLHLPDIELRSQGNHEAIGVEWIEIGAWKWVRRSRGRSTTTERPGLKARTGSPAAANALIDKSTSDPRCAPFACEDTVAEGGVGRISSC